MFYLVSAPICSQPWRRQAFWLSQDNASVTDSLCWHPWPVPVCNGSRGESLQSLIAWPEAWLAWPLRPGGFGVQENHHQRDRRAVGRFGSHEREHDAARAGRPLVASCPTLQDCEAIGALHSRQRSSHTIRAQAQAAPGHASHPALSCREAGTHPRPLEPHASACEASADGADAEQRFLHHWNPSDRDVAAD